jgi:hypothetical protein
MSRARRGRIADALRAVHELEASDPATRARIVEMLDAALEPSPHAPGGAPPLGGPVEFAPVELPPPAERPEAGRRRATRSFSQVLAVITAILGLLTSLVSLGFGVTRGGSLAVSVSVAALLIAIVAWLLARPVAARLIVGQPEAAALPAAIARAGLLDDPRRNPEPPVAPLLTPEWTRGILAVALSMNVPDGPLDVERLAEHIARERVPQRLPRLPHRSLSAGVQMLIDVSSSMQPFRADLVDIVAQVRRVVGEDRATVLRFAASPLAGAGAGRRATWRDYAPPPTPRPVLVVTDFELAAGPVPDPHEAVEAWLSWCRVVRAADCPLIALTPQPVSEVPRALRRHMAVIEWDRRTTAASAARAVRRG